MNILLPRKNVIFVSDKPQNTMDTIAARKYAIMEKIMHLSEEELTELEVSLMNFSEEDISIEQYNQELDEADAAIDRGEYITHEELKQQM